MINYSFKPRDQLDMEDPFDEELFSHAQNLINVVENTDDLSYILTSENKYTDLANYAINESFHNQEDIEKLIQIVTKHNLIGALESLIEVGFKGINESSRYDLNIALKRGYIAPYQVKDSISRKEV